MLCIALMAAFAACGNGEQAPAENALGTDVAASSSAALPEEELPELQAGETLDLTQLSANMVYAEVYNMMIEPQDFVGMTVKMAGQYAEYHDETTGKNYFACIISDALACCSQGIEFELTDAYSYPADYPKDGDEICVVGTFDTYTEGEYTYCTLRSARFE